jgi:hypothetical protein
MHNPIRLTLCLAGLLLPLAVLAEDSPLKVDVVVDLTPAGEKIVRPTPANPAYFYPIIKGYTEGGAKIGDQPPPPPSADVQRLIFKALYLQGYRLASKAHPPSLLLMLWWGYKAPISSSNGGYIANGGSLGGHGGGGAAGINQALQSGAIPVHALLNPDEMKELVLGGQFASGFGDTETNLPSIRMERLKNAWQVPRYFLMVSAMDFATAMTKDEKGRPNLLVYWTARVSTEIIDHTLEEVLPTLVANGAPMFGRKTDGPQWNDSPMVPFGRVIVGTPVLKDSAAPATEKQKQTQ